MEEANEKFTTNLVGYKKELLFKFLVIGDFGVGKTSIIRRYVKGEFSTNYRITIGADFALKQLDWDDTTQINLQLWDIAGHERFGYLTSVYYRYAIAAIIVFDLTRPNTFNSVQKWLTDLRGKVTLSTGRQLPVILLANKGDMTLRTIPEEITEFCKKHNILTWYITSAKEDTNIEEAIFMLTQEAVRNYTGNYGDIQEPITLTAETQNKKQKYPCCQQ